MLQEEEKSSFQEEEKSSFQEIQDVEEAIEVEEDEESKPEYDSLELTENEEKDHAFFSVKKFLKLNDSE